MLKYLKLVLKIENRKFNFRLLSRKIVYDISKLILDYKLILISHSLYIYNIKIILKN